MTFGTAILRTPIAKPKGLPRGRKPPTYDCGSYGRLTMGEMLRKSGVTKQTMRYRLKRGWQGAHLLSGPYSRAIRSPARPALAIAAKLAAKYPHKVPTDREMIALHPMTRAAAWAWRNAWRAALEVA